MIKIMNNKIYFIKHIRFFNTNKYKKVNRLYTLSDDNILKIIINNANSYNFANFRLYFKNLKEEKKNILFKSFSRKTIINNFDILLQNDFDWNNYISFHNDLKHMNENEAKIHYILYGNYEGRDYKNNNLYNNSDNSDNSDNNLNVNLNNDSDEIKDKDKYYFICTSKNSGDYCVASNLTQYMSNSKIITMNELNNYTFDNDIKLVFLDYSQMEIIDIKKFNCIKIAWIRNWEKKWLKYLKLFDYVLCCTNKAKEFIESHNIKSYILPIGSNFNEYNFNKSCKYDILIDCNLFNRRNIVDIAIKLVELNKYKIIIIGKNWQKYLTKREFNLIKPYYKEFINYNEIKNYYLLSKIIVDDCNINTKEFGSINQRITDVISCKRLIITNNKVGNSDLFENQLLIYNSYDELNILIQEYLFDENKYNTITNKLYDYGIKFMNNKDKNDYFENLKKYNLVLSACFKNEGDILEEFIKHYLDEGIEHFYLIDNGSNDDYINAINKYKDYITLIKDNIRYKNNTQTKLFHQYYYEKIKNESKWLLYCDIDEFVYSRNSYCKIIDLLDNCPNYIKQIWIPWKIYSCDNIIETPKSIINSLFYRYFNLKFIGEQSLGYGKFIIKTNYLDKLTNHYGIMINNNFTINNLYNSNFIKLIDEKYDTSLNLNLNHYMFISKEKYNNKIIKGGGENGFNLKYTDMFFNLNNTKMKEIYDDELIRKKKNLVLKPFNTNQKKTIDCYNTNIFVPWDKYKILLINNNKEYHYETIDNIIKNYILITKIEVAKIIINFSSIINNATRDYAKYLKIHYPKIQVYYEKNPFNNIKYDYFIEVSAYKFDYKLMLSKNNYHSWIVHDYFLKDNKKPNNIIYCRDFVKECIINNKVYTYNIKEKKNNNKEPVFSIIGEIKESKDYNIIYNILRNYKDLKFILKFIGRIRSTNIYQKLKNIGKDKIIVFENELTINDFMNEIFNTDFFIILGDNNYNNKFSGSLYCSEFFNKKTIIHQCFNSILNNNEPKYFVYNNSKDFDTYFLRFYNYFYNIDKIACVLIEPRKLKQVFYNIDNVYDIYPEIKLFFFCGKGNKEYFLKNIKKKHIDFIEIIELKTNNFLRQEYSNFIKNKNFLNHFINYNYIFTIQTDGCLCKNTNLLITDFIKYDYIGGSGPNTKTYWNKELTIANINISNFEYLLLNGGFSLRNIKAMQHVLEEFPPNIKNDSYQINNFGEDIYFALGMYKLGYKLGSDYFGNMFCSHFMFINNSLCIHNNRRYKFESNKILKYCPEYQLFLKEEFID